MTTVYFGFSDTLIKILSYIELSKFMMNKFSYDILEYISVVNAIVDYKFGPITVDVRLFSKNDLIYMCLTSNDNIEKLETGAYRIFICNPIQFLILSLYQLKEKI